MPDELTNEKILEDAKPKGGGRVPMVKKSHEHMNTGLAPHRIDDLTKQQLNHFSNFHRKYRRRYRCRLVQVHYETLDGCIYARFLRPEERKKVFAGAA